MIQGTVLCIIKAVRSLMQLGTVLHIIFTNEIMIGDGPAQLING